MTSTEYIHEKLRALISIFPGIQIRHEFIESKKSHLIEVKPAEFIPQNEDYQKAEAKIIEEFQESYPSENIFFISDDSPIQIQFPDLVLGFH